MTDFDIYFSEINYHFPLTFVKGTENATYFFGDGEKADIYIRDFFASKFLITQQLWKYIMGNNPSHFNGRDRPVENVSFKDVTQENGFLDKLNIAASDKYKVTFRLP